MTGSNRPLFVLTPQAELGPLDPQAMRDLLTAGGIAPDDRVRTALGKEVGSVAEVLAETAPAGGRATRALQARAAVRTPAVPTTTPARAPLVIAVAGGVGLAIVLTLYLTGGGSSQPTPASPARPATVVPVAITTTASATTAAPPQDASALPGLVAEIYIIPMPAGEVTMPALDGLTPSVRRIDTCIDARSPGPWPGTQLEEAFAVRWTGILRVPAEGLVTLVLESDDGSRLTLDGRVVIDNAGNHPPTEAREVLRLSAGDHPLIIDYFQGGVTYCCRLAWKPAAGDEVLLDGRHLLHRRDPTLDPR